MARKMYLRRFTEVLNSIEINKNRQVNVIYGGRPHPMVKYFRISSIVETMGAWENYASLHEWMLEHQKKDGSVMKESLERLQETLKQAEEYLMSNKPDNAKTIFYKRDNFINKGSLGQIQYTLSVLSQVLEEHDYAMENGFVTRLVYEYEL